MHYKLCVKEFLKKGQASHEKSSLIVILKSAKML